MSLDHADPKLDLDPELSGVSVAELRSWLSRRRRSAEAQDLNVPNQIQPELKDELKDELQGDSTIEVTHLTHDSRRARPGSLYVALEGRVTHGARFIQGAIERGAIAVALPSDTPPELLVDSAGDALELELIWLTPERARLEMAWLASRVYNTDFITPALSSLERSCPLSLVGLTGTNGKTTTSTLLAATLERAFGDVGLIGTIETRGGRGQTRAAQLTTMESPDLHAHYRALIDSDVTRCVMEVSSIGITEERVSASRYERAAFLNLSPDHLDYHGDMERYADAKLRLFSELLTPDAISVICVDGDTSSDRLAARAIERAQATGGEVWRCGSSSARDVYWRSLKLTARGLSGEVVTPRGSVMVRSPLIGDFNASNIAVAIALARSLDVDPELISSALERATVKGRMELIELEGISVRAPDGERITLPQVRVDYAHTPDALRRAIQALRAHIESVEGTDEGTDGSLAASPNTSARLWVIFGCGGGRDVTKRPLMGEAATLADGVVITSDNPRDESPTEIIEHALAGALKCGMSRSSEGPKLGAVWTEVDRALAIHKLLIAVGPHDIVLIAGKGHEPYQELSGGVRIHLSDAEIAREALSSRLHLSALSRVRCHARGEAELDALSLHTSALCSDAGGSLRAGSHRALSGPVIDTRTLSSAQAQAHSPSETALPAFFCLEGARDGHEFIPVALDGGVGAIVARRGHPILDQLTPLIEARGVALIEVSSPELALAQWASAHRRRVFSGALIGLTGSNGKTSTKELIAGALSKVGETLATSGNFNNHLGVPLTLLRLRASHRFAVIEMGMNAPDEIRALTSWADPDLGVITTIANAHLERLGSIEAVARAKGELISEIKRGPVLMPELISRELRREASAERSARDREGDYGLGGELDGELDGESRVLILGRADRDLAEADSDLSSLNPNERWFEPQVRLESVHSDLNGSHALALGLSESARELKTQLLGRHQLENARLALAASLYVTARESSTREIPLSERLELLLTGIAECPPAPLRGELLAYPRPMFSREVNHDSVISSLSSPEPSGQLWLDCYNANPQSTLAAVKTFFDCGLSGALILGSIGELGDASSELHYELGRAIASQLDADELLSDTAVFTIGEQARHIQRGLIDSGVATQRLDHYELEQLDLLMLRLCTLNPSAILIKGSRSVRLERLVPLIGAR